MENQIVASLAAAGSETDQSARNRRLKRTRVKMACQRCKTRKQKCDGNQPECSNCNRLALRCIYRIPVHSKPQEARMHIKALEDRVAELETTLTHHGISEEGADHWPQNQRRPNANDSSEKPEFSLAAVRDVSLNISGPFIGGTSTITLARMLESILGKGKEQLELQPTTDTNSPNDTSPESREDVPSADPETGSPIESPIGSGPFPNLIRGLQSHIADKLLQAYINNVMSNFPVLHSVQIRHYHRNRETLEDPYEVSILNLVYALGGQYLETTGQLAYPQWRHHYELALEKRDKVLRLGDTRTLAYLLLIIQQCLRVPRDPTGWTFIGIAMRLCVELGLHRKKRRYVEPNLRSELDKRLFWSCYYVDRDLSMALGRPPSISDHDIDVELPLDIDEDCEDPDVFRRTQRSDTPAFPSTSLTCFVHMVRLKKMESRIQYKIYRVDVLVNNLSQETELLLRGLDAWKATIPPQSHPRDAQNMDTYMLYYYKSIRLLLQPQLYESVINERYLKLCTEACIGVCDTYRRLLDRSSVAFTTISLQTIFVAGLTLIYCMWHAPSNSTMQSMSALSDCSIMLYVMTERWPNIKRYRDAFHAIKRSVINLITDEKNQPRDKLPAAIGDVWPGLNHLDFDMMENITFDDLDQMLNDINREGAQFPTWDDVNVDVYSAPGMADASLEN